MTGKTYKKHMKIFPYSLMSIGSTSLDMLDFTKVPEQQVRDAIAVIETGVPHKPVDARRTMSVDWLRAAVYQEMQDDFVEEHEAQIRVMHGLFACVPLTPAECVAKLRFAQPRYFSEAVMLFENPWFLHSFGNYMVASEFQSCCHPARSLAYLPADHTEETPYIKRRPYADVLEAFGLESTFDFDSAACFYLHAVEFQMSCAEFGEIKAAHKKQLHGHRNRIY